MCIRNRLHRLRPSVGTAFRLAAAITTASFPIAAATFDIAAATPAAAAAGCHGLLRDQLRHLHRRSEPEKLHSLAQLSFGLWQQPGVLDHADYARHRSDTDCDLL